MTHNKIFAIGRLGGYGAALALTAMLLNGCSSAKETIPEPPNNSRPSFVHIEFHKKMLAEQKKRQTKISEK